MIFLIAISLAFSVILCKNRYKNETHISEQETTKTVHVHKSPNWTVLRYPTCTEDGISVKICREYNRKYREKRLEKTGHIGTWRTIVEPTCTSKGIKRLVCEKCHEILDMEERPCLGHKYIDCVCTRCGYVTLQDKVHHQMFFTKYTAETTGIKLSGNVVIPSVITYAGEKYEIIGIGYALCYGNKTITSITFPNTIKYIEGYAFDHCENMVSCNLPDGLISIGSAAFQCCSRLKHVELPNSLQQIGNFAFNHCSGVDNTCIRIPDSIKLLGKFPEAPAHMFYDCGTDAFTEFQIGKNKNGYLVQDGILYARDGKTLFSIPRGKTFENGIFEVPNTVENLGELSFSRNNSIHTVVISDSMLITGEATEKEQQSYNNIGNQLSISCYVYHELGHFLAWISGSRDKTAEFKAIYEKEKSKMTSANHVYNTQNSSEYFAESYREFCINPDGLKKQCPQTYNVIKAAVNYLNSKSDSYLANIKQAYEEIYWN